MRVSKNHVLGLNRLTVMRLSREVRCTESHANLKYAPSHGLNLICQAASFCTDTEEMPFELNRKNKGRYSVSEQEQRHADPNGELRAEAEKEKGQHSKERWWTVLVATLVAALGPVSFGYAMGYSSAAVTQLGKPNQDLHLDEDAITWFGVSVRRW